MIKRIVLSAVLLAATGCVSSPSSVPATYVDSNKFADQSCEDAIATKHKLNADLANLSKKQSASRARGIAYNLILIPGAGALSKDRSGEIGLLKGDIQAVDAHALRICG